MRLDLRLLVRSCSESSGSKKACTRRELISLLVCALVQKVQDVDGDSCGFSVPPSRQVELFSQKSCEINMTSLQQTIMMVLFGSAGSNSSSSAGREILA